MKAVIMAGGKGTRISSITGDIIPKPMLKILDKPILEYQIDCLKKNNIKDIVIVVGHLGEVIKNYFKDGKDFGVHISYYDEDENNPLGTAGSLYYLRDYLTEDFVFLLGDIFFDIDLESMITFHKEHQSFATLLTHPNSHPYDSDLIKVKGDTVIDFDSKENDRSNYDYKNLVNSGIYILNPQILSLITSPKKLAIEKDIISRFIKDKKVFSYHSTEYVKDMGTPERFASVIKDFKNDLPKKRNKKNPQKCIFLDRDGTINKYKGYILDKKDLELLPGAAEAIRKINSSDYLCIVVTNQPIIARGESTIENLESIHDRLETLLGKDGAFLDDIFYCPHHPDSGFSGEVPELKIKCKCRKPGIGLLIDAKEKYNIDLENSVVIGDSWRDIETGKSANAKTIYLTCGAPPDDKHQISADYTASDLQEAINNILKG